MSKTHADSQIPNLKGALTSHSLYLGVNTDLAGWVVGKQCVCRRGAWLGIVILFSCGSGDAATLLLISRSMSSSRLNRIHTLYIGGKAGGALV